MAISTNGGGNGSRRRGGSPPLSEINVTPFVDVVLVLLIIFMLTAHVMEYGIDVDVPKVSLVKETAKELPIVSVQKDGNIYLDKDPVGIHDLGGKIHQRFRNPEGVYIRSDGRVVWETVAQVMAEVGAAGFKVYMVTQPEDSVGRPR
jgi:biopolymer transport protein ExbD